MKVPNLEEVNTELITPTNKAWALRLLSLSIQTIVVLCCSLNLNFKIVNAGSADSLGVPTYAAISNKDMRVWINSSFVEDCCMSFRMQ